MCGARRRGLAARTKEPLPASLPLARRCAHGTGQWGRGQAWHAQRAQRTHALTHSRERSRAADLASVGGLGFVACYFLCGHVGLSPVLQFAPQYVEYPALHMQQLHCGARKQ